MNIRNSRLKVICVAAATFGLLAIIGLALRSHDNKQAAVQDRLASQQKALASSPYADPILKYLPYGDLGYNINPVIGLVQGKLALTLNISIIFSDADYRSSSAQQQKLIDQRETESLNYIKSKGFDPHKYRIVFQTPNN